MYGPARLLYALRPKPTAGVLAAVVATSVMFAATPFLIPAIPGEFGVSLGRAGLLSTMQVGAFAAAAFVAGRRLAPRRRYLVGAALVSVAVNLASVPIDSFELLLVARAGAGAAAGVLVWLAWSNGMQSSSALRNVAAIGPVTVFLATPVLSALVSRWGVDAVFLTVATVSLLPVVLPAQFTGRRRDRQRVSPSRSNVVLVVTLGVVTLAGSALFVYAAALGQDKLGMDATVVSIGYSLNALAGLVGARVNARERPQGLWIAGTGVSAAMVAFGSPALFLVGLATWGFFFWLTAPNILRAVAAWSLAPDERVGDAQSTMALGRAIGPAVGGLIVAGSSFELLGWFTVVMFAFAAGVVWRVDHYRRDHRAPDGTLASQA